MFVYNPEGFEPKDHLPGRLHPYADCARVLVHLVETARVFNKLHATEFVPRKAEYLRRLVHKEMYLPLRDALLASGVLDWHPHYVVGKQSFGFRIGRLFEEAIFRRFRLTDRAAIRRVQRVRAEQSPRLTAQTHIGLQRWLNRLEVDYDAACAFLLGMALPAEVLRARHLSLAILRDREFFFKPDLYGRVHTNLTNLWSGFRRFLCFEGERLVNIDICNSQPLFFGLVVLNWIRSGNGTQECTDKNLLSPLPSSPSHYDAESIKTKTTTAFNGECTKKNLLPPLPSFPSHYDAESIKTKTTASSHKNLPDDLRRYLQITSQAQFYEHMMAALSIPITKPNRDAFKEDFFGKVFYCKPNYYTKERKAFLAEFPTVLDHITRLKQEDHRNAPLALQRAESEFVIGTVCKRILNQSPETPLWTIHDSIMTTASRAEYVRMIMEEEFANLGVHPRLRIEETGHEPVPVTLVPPLRAEVAVNEVGSGLLAGDPPTLPLTPPGRQLLPLSPPSWAS